MEPLYEMPEDGNLEEFALCHKMNNSWASELDDDRIYISDVIRQDEQTACSGDVFLFMASDRSK